MAVNGLDQLSVSLSMFNVSEFNFEQRTLSIEDTQPKKGFGKIKIHGFSRVKSATKSAAKKFNKMFVKARSKMVKATKKVMSPTIASLQDDLKESIKRKLIFTTPHKEAANVDNNSNVVSYDPDEFEEINLFDGFANISHDSSEFTFPQAVDYSSREHTDQSITALGQPWDYQSFEQEFLAYNVLNLTSTTISTTSDHSFEYIDARSYMNSQASSSEYTDISAELIYGLIQDSPDGMPPTDSIQERSRNIEESCVFGSSDRIQTVDSPSKRNRLYACTSTFIDSDGAETKEKTHDYTTKVEFESNGQSYLTTRL